MKSLNRRRPAFATLLVFVCSMVWGVFAMPSTNLPPRASILTTARLVNDYWLANAESLGSDLANAEWNMATYYAGNQRFYEITGDPAYLDQAVAWGASNQWLRSEKSRFNGDQIRNDEDPDNHCCGQTYIDLYKIDPQPERIADMIRLEDYIVSQERNDFLSWIDTIFMQAPTMAKLSTLTNSAAYSDKLWAMYQHTKDVEGTVGLFDATEGLWFRDSKYIYPNRVTSGGNKVFWARGNGWVIAGLVRAIEALPESDPHRADYITMVQTMAAALVPLQQSDGFWRSSLLEPTQFDMPETSGTSFYTYAMAWGINNGILDRETYLPVVAKAWNGLVAESVHPEGFLGYVQLVAAEPGASYYEDTKAYGVGAFLLAASELSLLADDVFAAHAGLDQVVYDTDLNGSEPVTLDGTGTHDPDDTVETFEWFDGATLIATGITAQVTLPLGVHTITLRVTDTEAGQSEDDVQITITQPAPERVYLETFDNPSGDSPLSNYGWSVLLTEDGVISDYTNQSRAAGVASGDYGFYAPKADDNDPWTAAVLNNPALVKTAAPTGIAVEGLDLIRWDASGDNTDHEYRVAIEVGGVWYASQAALNDGVPDSGTTVNLPLTYSPASFATASNWLTVQNSTLGNVGVLSLGAAPGSDLSGLVTAFGLYLVSGTDNEAAGDHVRFDNVEVYATLLPEKPLAITSFTSIGAGVWEITIEGRVGTDYEFYSSTDLSFAPGTLLTSLTQADPSNDPGSVTGGNRLTTDGTGYGKVRITLTGDPADFIRVQAAP